MPEVFYDMELEDFFLMQKGYFNRRKADEIRFAKVAFYVNAIGENLAGKTAHGEKFIMQWLGEQPRMKTQEQLVKESEAVMARLALMQKIDDERKKNGRTAKNSN